MKAKTVSAAKGRANKIIINTLKTAFGADEVTSF
jgi:uncharacterized protein YggU (UPF0235/DUF167 family)